VEQPQGTVADKRRPPGHNMICYTWVVFLYA